MNQTSRPWTIQCFHGTAYVDYYMHRHDFHDVVLSYEYDTKEWCSRTRTSLVTIEKDTPFNDGKELSKDMTKKLRAIMENYYESPNKHHTTNAQQKHHRRQ